MDTSASSTSSFSVSLSRGGALAPLLGPAVVPPSIPPERRDYRDFERTEVSKRAVKALMAMHIGLLSEVTSSDQMFMAMNKAKRLALLMGLSKEDFDEVMENFMKVWQAFKEHNPIASMTG